MGYVGYYYSYCSVVTLTQKVTSKEVVSIPLSERLPGPSAMLEIII